MQRIEKRGHFYRQHVGRAGDGKASEPVKCAGSLGDLPSEELQRIQGMRECGGEERGDREMLLS